MQTIFIFAIILVLPNGEVAVQSKKTQSCPNEQDFALYMSKSVEDGLVHDWEASCTKLEMKFPEKGA